jgi:hypothetical protein
MALKGKLGRKRYKFLQLTSSETSFEANKTSPSRIIEGLNAKAARHF